MVKISFIRYLADYWYFSIHPSHSGKTSCFCWTNFILFSFFGL